MIIPPVKGVDSSITEWFSRPQLIQTLPWIENGSINTTIFPLAQFFDPTITSNWDKIKGYSRVRGTLHLKLELNASPFHFGALNVSWAPLTSEQGNSTVGKINYDVLNSFSGASLSAYGDGSNSDNSALMKVTQRLNGFLYPQDCNTLDFEIPFLYPKEFIELRSQTYSSNTFANNSVELYQFGSLVFVTAVPLTVAQTLTGGIATINVFAWMTDVELEGPSLVITSGVVQAAGSAMTSFKDVPIVGGYLAKAGAISKASAKVMSLLGMSNHPSESKPTEVVPSAMPALSSVEIDSNSRYLGLAPRSGLTMAPTESWSDELEIDQFGKPVVALGVSSWDISTSKGVSVFRANVTPEVAITKLLSGLATGDTVSIVQPPAAYVSSMFGQWRGKIKYHFTAVASQYHRGRLRMYYDAAINDTVSFKEGFLFSKVWDITETKNFEFEVPFTAATQMLTLSHPQYKKENVPSTINYALSAGTTIVSTDLRFHNGFVNLIVLNQLLGPNAAGVKIICSMSISDLEFAEPTPPGTWLQGASGSTTTLVQSQSYLSLSHNYRTTSAVPSDHKKFDAELYNGERVLSLRTLLHRSCDYTLLAAPSSSTGQTGNLGCLICNRYTIPREPVSPGEHSYGTSASRVSDTTMNFSNNFSTSGTTGYSYVAMTPFVFLKGMFAGYRGSFRIKAVADQPVFQTTDSASMPNLPTLTSLSITRSHDYVGATTWTSTRGTGASASRVAYDSVAQPDKRGQMALRGSEFNASVFGNTLSVDVPFYSKYKFLPTNDATRSFPRTGAPTLTLGAVSGDGVYHVASDCIDIDCRYINPLTWQNAATSNARSPTLRLYTSCGTDFSFVGFINTPTLYMTTTLPNPTD